jgi:hypothetical protein
LLPFFCHSAYQATAYLETLYWRLAFIQSRLFQYYILHCIRRIPKCSTATISPPYPIHLLAENRARALLEIPTARRLSSLPEQAIIQELTVVMHQIEAETMIPKWRAMNPRGRRETHPQGLRGIQAGQANELRGKDGS